VIIIRKVLQVGVPATRAARHLLPTKETIPNQIMDVERPEAGVQSLLRVQQTPPMKGIADFRMEKDPVRTCAAGEVSDLSVRCYSFHLFQEHPFRAGGSFPPMKISVPATTCAGYLHPGMLLNCDLYFPLEIV